MAQTPNEMYNLRWNCYVSNLLSTFTEQQNSEYLVDVTIGAEGQLIKAHKIILSACSSYFQTHGTSPLLILLNDVKFEHLKLIIQFMYKGEVKVADGDMPKFLQLGRMLQVKGLCSVELQEKQKGDVKLTKKECPKTKTPIKIAAVTTKKRKLSSTNEIIEPKKSVPPTDNPEKDANLNARPPNAFMIFANQWRKKLSVEYPKETNKDISVRLGNMWKSLSSDTKDTFYEEARVAEEEYKAKNNKNRAKSSEPDCILFTEPEFVDVQCKGEKSDDIERANGM